MGQELLEGLLQQETVNLAVNKFLQLWGQVVVSLPLEDQELPGWQQDT